MAVPKWKWGVEEKPDPTPEPKPIVQPRRKTSPLSVKESWRDKPKKAEPETAPYDYLVQHSKGKEKQRLIQAGRVPGAKGKYAASIIAGRLAHGRLTHEQKEEYGFRHTDWKSIPVSERSKYYGGKRHLQSLPLSKREKVIERFKKEEPTSAIVYEELFKALHGISYEEPMKKQMWKGLTMSPGELQKDFWKRVPDVIRWQVSGVHAFASATLWGITLPQSLVKLFTGGKTLVLPDVGKELSKHKPMAMPHGLISTGISEGIGAYTGEGSDAWAKFKEDPISGIFASVGEIAGLKVGGVAVSGVVKSFGVARIGLKYGKKDMLAYIRGEKVLVKSYPVVKGYPKIFRGGEKYASIWKYKGFGKKELVSLKEASALGKTGSAYLRYTPFGKRLEFRVIYENLKVKGLFRKSITKTYASTGKSHWVLEKGVTGKPVHMFTARDSGMVVKGFLKDTSAYQTLAPQTLVHARPMLSGKMHHAGYLGKELIKMPLQDMSIGSLSSLGYLSASALSNELRQRDRSLSLDKSMFKTISAYDTMPSLASVSLLETKQMQKMKSASMMKSAMLSEAKLSHSTGGRGSGNIGGNIFSSMKIRFPIAISDEDLKIGKKLGKEKIGELGYREREWQVGKIESMFNIGSLEKEMKKLMKGGKL